MPCFARFDRQPAAYRDEVLPRSCRRRVSIEATVTSTWARYVGLDGATHRNRPLRPLGARRRGHEGARHDGRARGRGRKAIALKPAEASRGAAKGRYFHDEVPRRMLGPKPHAYPPFPTRFSRSRICQCRRRRHPRRLPPRARRLRRARGSGGTSVEPALSRSRSRRRPPARDASSAAAARTSARCSTRSWPS